MVELPVGTVTLLFADIEGSTRLVQDLGDAYGGLLNECRRMLRTEVAAARGFEVDCRADELFAVFQDADDAAAAAVGAQRALAAHPWPQGSTVRVRIGLHTGEPAIEGGAYFGLDVNRAARICSAGHGGQILLSRRTHDLLDRHAQFTDLGMLALPGLGEPERLFQLESPGLPIRFPPLRAESRGERWSAGHLLSRLPGRRRAPGLRELAWQIRALLPAVERPLQKPLAELGATVFSADRAAATADSFLGRIDRKRLEERMADQRGRAVVSRRARDELDATEARLGSIDDLQDGRRAVDALAEQLSRKLPSLRTDEEIGVLRDRLSASTATLDDAVTRAAAILDPLSFRLRRTRHRGVYRYGTFYAVCYFDEVGSERVREFATVEQARQFRATMRIAEKNRTSYRGLSPSEYPLEEREVSRGDDQHGRRGGRDGGGA